MVVILQERRSASSRRRAFSSSGCVSALRNAFARSLSLQPAVAARRSRRRRRAVLGANILQADETMASRRPDRRATARSRRSRATGASARRARAARVGSAPPAPLAGGRRAQQPEIARGKRVGLAERAQRHVLHRPLADAGDREQGLAHRLRVGAGLERERRPTPPRARAGAASRRAREGRPIDAMSASTRASGRGNTTCTPSPSGSPQRLAMRPVIVVAAATEICCPTIARIASSNPFQAPGTRSAGQRSTHGRSSRSRRRCSRMTAGSAPRSNTRRARSITAGRCTGLDRR